jgi:alpha-tubulin suppressor-like RCC1 family protein
VATRLLEFVRVLILAAASSCVSGEEGISGPDPGGRDPVVSVAVSPSAVGIRDLADSVQLHATGRTQAGASVSDRTVSWVSSAPTVASVSSSGIVRPVAAGTATITATIEGVSGSAEALVDFWVAVSAGNQFSCAVTVSGTAYCWGDNSAGQLGGVTTTALATRPTAVAGGVVFRSISAGAGYACGVTADHAAYCWGDNSSGQLGDGSRANRSAPVRVAGDLAFVSVSTVIPVGYVGKHSCGVTEFGAAYCWGDNLYGQLGNGSTANSSVPVAVAGDLTVNLVSVGSRFSCAATTGNVAHCWGTGGGAPVDTTRPVVIPGDLAVASISSQFEHACAVTSFGVGYCWGSGVFGKLGTGSTNSALTPTAVSGALTFAAIQAGVHHTCGVTTNGEGYCWGGNGHGALGSGNTIDSPIPIPVSGQHQFVAMSAGLSHSCGITTTGALYCWGSGSAGELGNGSTTDNNIPRRVADP